ncbi:MAG: hypothetical protein CO129_06800 [Ignavibacteriales bacterium CG_4_9_14_3_um_filter_34_10]|nr:MAG: hypothetical protein CO129_06800 [Ignavibacteriales bacterium CG_4_9_14_3_um_filter_34_10]
MKRKIYLVILIMTFLASNSFAQLFRSTSKVGTTAAQFLKIGAGARAIGMGGAYTALGTDIYSIYWNPAGVAQTTSSNEVAFNHANWLADIKYDFAAGVINMQDFGVLTASFTSLQVPEDKVRTFDKPEGDGRTWDASAIAIGLGYSKNLTDRFSIGFQAKYIRETVWNSGSSGFAFDVGTLYRTPFNDLMIGASISNFGSKMRLDGRDIRYNDDPNDNLDTGPNNVPALYRMDDFDLPLTFRIGLAMDVISTRYFKFSAAVDAVHPNDNTEYMNVGGEISYDNMLFVRVGYKSLFMENSEQSMTYGGGIKYPIMSNLSITINYAYAKYGRLENVQFFDIGLIF